MYQSGKLVSSFGLLPSAVLAFFICGCSVSENASRGEAVSLVTPALDTQAPRDEDLIRVNSVLLLPSFIEERAKGAAMIPSALDSSFESLVREVLSIDVIGSQKTRPLQMHNDRRALVLKFHPDATLQLRLHTFEERKGSAIGVSQPAAVGFEVSLLRSSDSALIWSANYFRRDEALTDNLLRLNERIKDSEAPHWSSADSLLKDGLRKALQDLADRRVAKFSK